MDTQANKIGVDLFDVFSTAAVQQRADVADGAWDAAVAKAKAAPQA